MSEDVELAEGWATISFESVLTELRNGISTKPELKPPGTPILRINAVRPGRVLLDDLRYLPGGQNLAATFSVRDGDLMFTRYNGSLELLGVCGLIRGLGKTTLLYPDKLMRARLHESVVLPSFVELYFQSPEARERLTGEAKSSAGQQGISGSDLKRQVLSVAPLPEQHRIVEQVEALLAQVNKAKDRLDRVKVILKRFRQAVLAAACSGKLTEEWREEHPNADVGRLLDGLRCSRVQDDDKALPASWAAVRFDAAVVNHDGKRVPIKSSDREKRRGEFPYYGASGVIDTIDAFLFDGTFLLIAEDGANLLSRSTPIAFPASGRFWVNNHAHVVQPRAGILLSYLEICLNAIDLQHYVTGTAQPKLTQAALNGILIPLAPSEEQVEIVRLVQKMFSLADTIEARLSTASTRAQKLPQSILAKAFRGELVPTEADLARAEGRSFESAEEMLKRVTHSTSGHGDDRRRRRSAE